MEPLVAPSRRRAASGRAIAALCWAVVTPLTAVAGARLAAHDATFVLVALNAFTTWLYVPAWLVLPFALATRRPALAIAAGTLAALHLAWIAPGALVASSGPRAPVGAPTLRVMSANVLAGSGSDADVAIAVRDARPDVLVVEELTPEWLASFAASDAARTLPHAAVVPRDDCFGIGIFSRLPLRAEALDLGGVPMLRAEISVGAQRATLLGVHTLPPRTPAYARVWDAQMQELAARVERERGPTVLVGDLNATPHARNYQRLVSGRMRGAHEDRGRNLATTWPNGLFPLPPVRLDHVLVSRELAVLEVSELPAGASDHSPVVATLALAGTAPVALAAEAHPWHLAVP